MIRVCFIALLLFNYMQPTSMANEDEMPIIAYMGVPDWRTSEEDFRTLSECGFNVSLYPYASLDLMVQACRYADKYGVKILGRCPEMRNSPTKTANTLKKEKGFFGYIIQDEPTVPEIRERQKDILKLKRIDSTHCFYINLQPYYHEEWVKPSMKAKSYPEYLKAASAASTQQISFDFYPITTKGIRGTWYHNLEMVRNESQISGKPFWGFVLSVPHDVPFTPDTFYPTPTLGSLRLQIYSNLAYGAQAIQYFTYWNPGESEGFHYHDAPISRDGKRNDTYFLVQQMNKELRQVAPLFYGANITEVHHLVSIPHGTSKQMSTPTNIRSLKIVGRQGAIISQFNKDGHSYMAIVNKSHERKIKVSIKLQNDTPRQISKDLKEQSIKSTYIVAAGDILIFKLK